MITYKLHLIRTGSTSPRLEGRYVGQKDYPLCAKGKRVLCELLKNYEYPRAETVFTSPLARCTATADILYPEVYTRSVPGLADLDLGEFEGKTPQELSGNPAFEAWIHNSLENTPPGGESLPDFTARITTVLGEIFAVMMEERLKNAAVIAHAGVIMTLLAAIGQPKAPPHEWLVPNGRGYTLLLTPQMWMRDGSCEVLRRIP